MAVRAVKQDIEKLQGELQVDNDKKKRFPWQSGPKNQWTTINNLTTQILHQQDNILNTLNTINTLILPQDGAFTDTVGQDNSEEPQIAEAVKRIQTIR